MTKRIILSIIIFAFCSAQAGAAEYEFIADDHSNATKFCIAAAGNDRDGLRRAIRKLQRAPHQKHKTIVSSIRCNGQIAAEFALAYEASDSFHYLYKFTDNRLKKLIPSTYVEELAASKNETSDARIVYVHVTGR